MLDLLASYLLLNLGGQKHCRQVDKGGYSIFEKMQEKLPDFFIANGDMIYAADQCPVEGPTRTGTILEGISPA